MSIMPVMLLLRVFSLPFPYYLIVFGLSVFLKAWFWEIVRGIAKFTFLSNNSRKQIPKEFFSSYSFLHMWTEDATEDPECF